MDVSDARSTANAVACSVAAFGKLTLLINVAAAPTIQGTVETIDEADWDMTFAVNVKGRADAPKNHPSERVGVA